MRKIIISILMMLTLCVNNSSAQTAKKNVVREGKTFKQKFERAISKKDTLITAYSYEDSKGNKYPIIINRKSGSCYVWRTSKAGKKYPDYMGEEISRTICKELGIEYKKKKKK